MGVCSAGEDQMRCLVTDVASLGSVWQLGLERNKLEALTRAHKTLCLSESAGKGTDPITYAVLIAGSGSQGS